MLKGMNAVDPSINQSWQQDNQAWWDWYVTLADNSNSNSEDTLLELPEPPKKKFPSKINTSIQKIYSVKELSFP